MITNNESSIKGELPAPFYNEPQTVYTRNAIKRGTSQFAFKSRPTAFLTLTVKEPWIKYRHENGKWLIKETTLIKTASDLLHYVNRDCYGRNYRKNEKGLYGWGQIAPQKNHQPHLHLLILNKHISPLHFLKLSRSIKSKVQKLNLFDTNGTDFRLIGGEDSDHFRIGDYIGREGYTVTFDRNGIT